MPNARAHDVITVITGVALAPPTYLVLLGQGLTELQAGYGAGLLVGSHLLSGILFSPDLDIDSAIDNRWGIFYWLWRPYMWITPHRRWFSHGLILPPLLRLVYLGGILTLLFLGASWVLGEFGILVSDYHLLVIEYLLELMRTHTLETWLCAIGFMTGGAAHTIADWLVTRGKKYLRRLGLRGLPVNYTGDRH